MPSIKPCTDCTNAANKQNKQGQIEQIEQTKICCVCCCVCSVCAVCSVCPCLSNSHTENSLCYGIHCEQTEQTFASICSEIQHSVDNIWCVRERSVCSVCRYPLQQMFVRALFVCCICSDLLQVSTGLKIFVFHSSSFPSKKTTIHYRLLNKNVHNLILFLEEKKLLRCVFTPKAGYKLTSSS